MPTTDVDIVNRALQLIGTRTTIASLVESSNEAIQANLCYAPVRDWCLGIANWNFARRTSALTRCRTTTVPPPVNWTDAMVSPPWLYEYLLPATSIRMHYITNFDRDEGLTKYLGEPKRFVISVDVVATEQSVLLTNEATVIGVYTARIDNPAEWPWMFERFVVGTLAWTLCLPLTGDKELLKTLDATASRFLDVAIQANLAEGLSFGDTTPEWIQALGINYPYRRDDGKDSHKPPQQGRGNDNSR